MRADRKTPSRVGFLLAAGIALSVSTPAGAALTSRPSSGGDASPLLSGSSLSPGDGEVTITIDEAQLSQFFDEKMKGEPRRELWAWAQDNATSPDPNPPKCSISAEAHSCKIQSLKNGTTYTIYLGRPVNDGGTLKPLDEQGSWPSAIPKYEAVSEMTDVRATQIGHSIVVSWSAPKSNPRIVTVRLGTFSPCTEPTTTEGSGASACLIPIGSRSIKGEPRKVTITAYQGTEADSKPRVTVRTVRIGPLAPQPNKSSHWRRDLLMLGVLVLAFSLGFVTNSSIKRRREPRLPMRTAAATSSAADLVRAPAPSNPRNQLVPVVRFIDATAPGSIATMVSVAAPEGFAVFEDGITRRVAMLDDHVALPGEQVTSAEARASNDHSPTA